MARTTRRQLALLAAAGAAGAFMPHALAQNAAPLITRAIPKSGEQSRGVLRMSYCMLLDRFSPGNLT